jgi:hypothetical protein
MNDPADLSIGELQEMWEDAQRYAYLKRWAKRTRNGWCQNVLLFTDAPTFDAAVDEARHRSRQEEWR